MTLGVAFIILMMLISVVMIIIGPMEDAGEVFATGIVLLIFTGVIIWGRYDVVSREELKKECINQGKQTIEIENKLYCKL